MSDKFKKLINSDFGKISKDVLEMPLDSFIDNEKKLPFGLYITNSVQEEVGLYGATMIAQTIKPNIAIVTDVTHDTTTPHLVS